MTRIGLAILLALVGILFSVFAVPQDKWAALPWPLPAFEEPDLIQRNQP